MATKTQFVVSALFGACSLVAVLALEAQAQIDLQKMFTGVPMARRQWEQRMLGQTGPQHTPVTRPAPIPGGPGVGNAAPGHRIAAPGNPAGSRVRQMSGVEEYELTPEEAARAAAEGVYLEPLPNGGVSGQHVPHGTFSHQSNGCATCQGEWGGCDVGFEHHGGCQPCGPTFHDHCGTCAVGPRPCWGHAGCRGLFRDLSIFAGVHGFKGPFDQGPSGLQDNGNFGFHEGFNFGSPLGGPWGLGYQLGLNVVHSNFARQSGGAGAGESRNQLFFTGGIFSRQCIGMNWGVAFDYLSDSYYANANLKQIRTETSWRFPTGGELGYWGAYGVGGEEQLLDDLHFKSTDLFAFYYRRHFQRGGDGRLWAGFSGQGDGLLGADIRVPIGHGWALENSLNYLSPKDSDRRESWGVNIQLVWYLGQPAECALQSPYRPLFSVANNATFMADLRRN